MNKKLNRKKSHRDLMLRNLATSIILYEKIKTTEAKAKAVKPIIEKIIHLGKRKDFSAIRKLYQLLLDKNAVKKIQEDLSKRLEPRKSGFLRITRIEKRAGDSAPIVLIELIVPKKIEEKKEIIKTKVSTKVTTKVRTKPTEEPSIVNKKVEKIEKIKPERLKTKKTKIEDKKGWLDRVSHTRIGKRITSATKKIWTKRTTSK
jgi:large subunit ribosomal protein L17